jgi:hypothetical protein
MVRKTPDQMQFLTPQLVREGVDVLIAWCDRCLEQATVEQSFYYISLRELVLDPLSAYLVVPLLYQGWSILEDDARERASSKTTTKIGAIK